jgi:Na+-transporting NADH:ubiquinone oxidoreductase subunit C
MPVDNNSPNKAILVVALVAVVCSSLVSAAVVLLRPIQLNNQLLERSRNIIQLTGLIEPGQSLEDEEMLSLFKSLDVRVVDIDKGVFDDSKDADTFDQRRTAGDPELGVAVPSAKDLANLGTRSRFAPVYLVWDGSELSRIILPIRGAGMWSMLYGYLALESDLNTVAAATFYEQAETPGLGDQITRPDWLTQWQGRKVYDDGGNPVFAVGPGTIRPDSPAAQHRVDALTGATVTGDAVTSLVHYWLGPHGFQPLLNQLREQPPTRVATVESRDS